MTTLRIPGCISFGEFELDLRLMNLPEDFVETHRERASAAVDSMKSLVAGGVANPDEKRQVGHYWLRGSEATGYETQIADALSRIGSLEERHGQFSNVLWIGIGGSGLGPQLLYDALSGPTARRVFWFDNTDPAGFQRVLTELDGHLDQTLTVVVSKSGGTQETKNGMLVAAAAYAKQGLVFADHAIAITQEGSGLDEVASGQVALEGASEPRAWRERFPLWDWVGGRTSLFSSVGLVAARLFGLDTDALLAGASAVDQATAPKSDKLDENPAMAMAAAWYHATQTLKRFNLVVLPYSDRLELFGKYLQQLIMESIGKEGQGLSVFGNKGTTDQHSFVQQLREGRNDYIATFVRVVGGPDYDLPDSDVTVGDYLAAFQEGSARALFEAGRLSMRLTIDEVNESTLGGLIALFERTVGYYATMIGINAYHQPGVEAGKKAAQSAIDIQKQLIESLAGGKALTVDELARMHGAPADLVHGILDRLRRRGRFDLRQDEGDSGDWTQVRFSR